MLLDILSPRLELNAPKRQNFINIFSRFNRLSLVPFKMLLNYFQLFYGQEKKLSYIIIISCQDFAIPLFVPGLRNDFLSKDLRHNVDVIERGRPT